MSDRSARSREMPEVKRVNVVVSRYALALQRNNHKLCLNTATTKTKALRSRDDAIRSISSTRQTPPAAPAHLKPSSKQHQKQTKDSGVPYRIRVVPTAKDLSAQSLYPTPRPAFPTRIPSPILKESNHQEMRRSKPADMSKIKSSYIRYGEVETKMTMVDSSHSNAPSNLSKTDELELLQRIHYQLCFAEAKAEDTFRRQEQLGQSQMFVAWEILQAKLRQLQESSIGLDRQRHANLMKIYVENVSESSALLAEQLPRFLDSISQLCTSVQIAINRLSCSGISCTNPLQLKHHMEALTLDLDDLLEWIKATNIGNSITSTFSTDHEMQRLAEQSTSALLQIAHLVTELRVGGNSGKHVPNANKNDNLD
ncbi:hypothetical protein JG688_00006693 [Phytophthora aleatoria]|uniref:Uncharacterized protein n=1 Tax=Phytophthora aleatoria TaxID=2496075 RepID=A0A8J5J8N1_9STRA|nr:hypothetical protein JG688_00006693 [Phytophthora aleatoria]